MRPAPPTSPLRLLPSIVLLATLLAILPAALPADEVELTNGRVLTGEAQRLPDGRVEIADAGGSVILPASLVAEVRQTVTAEAVVDEMLAELIDPTAEDLYQIAIWCWEQGAITRARQLLEAVLEIDPDHAGARRKLGFRQLQGYWLTEKEYRAARGEVRFRGDWVPAAERARILADESARRRADSARRQAVAELTALEAERRRLEIEGRQAAPYGTYGPTYGPGIPLTDLYSGGGPILYPAPVGPHGGAAAQGGTPPYLLRVEAGGQRTGQRTGRRPGVDRGRQQTAPRGRATPRSNRSGVRTPAGSGARSSAGSRPGGARQVGGGG